MTSESWAGFTDEDIKRIKSSPSLSDFPEEISCETGGLFPARRKERLGAKKVAKREWVSADTLETNAVDECSPKEARKFKNKTLKPKCFVNEDESFHNDSVHSYGEKISKTDELIKTGVSDHQKRDAGIQLCNYEVDAVYSPKDDAESQCENETHDEEQNLPALELFELRQKRIEAENARRRTLINKAITDKKMQTQAEAIKLAKITDELNHLDSILSADVSILRNYIEKASLEFSEAEKRYLKAEKEFVEAKLILFEKMQRKEQLTEHLCAIIEQNENRKANKLLELMKQLEMETVIEEYDTNSIQPILSNLCILNDEAYQSCQTLKPNSVKSSTNATVPEQKNSTEEHSEDVDFPSINAIEEFCIKELQ